LADVIVVQAAVAERDEDVESRIVLVLEQYPLVDICRLLDADIELIVSA
jgi:hypothetical protein